MTVNFATNKKTTEIERALRVIWPERANTDIGLCVFCSSVTGSFKNAISAREHKISGLCQKCQDEFFEMVEIT